MSLYDKLPDKSYLKKLLMGLDGVLIEKFLETKAKYENETDKDEKRVLKDRMIGVFWELYIDVAKMINPELSKAKRLFLRFGLVDLRYLSPKDQEFILNVPIGNINYETDTIFYADEWLQGVLDGKIKASAVDETENQPTPSKVDTVQVGAKQEKYISLIEVETNRLEGFKAERSKCIAKMAENVALFKEDHTPSGELAGEFSKEQQKGLEELLYFHKEIKKLNKEISGSVRTINKAQDSLNSSNADESEGESINLARIQLLSEVSSIRQMVKMTIGRQGNSFPYLSSNLLAQKSQPFLFREELVKRMNYWMEFDPKVFERTYKNDNMNIAPYIILVPGAGVMGVCWEPLDVDNKQFGRGRLAVPIFTRTPDISFLTACADIRWQAAKEIASYYWMEEGLTGRYYDYVFSEKLKGDLRTMFIKDYLLWMTKEVQGVQKLHQDARYVFWRYVPLPDERKVILSKKGYYYNDLWEKEQVWRRSGK